MKKNILFLMAGLALAGCSSDPYEDWANPQHSGAEDAKNVELAITNAPDIDFGTLASDSVQIFTPTVSATNTTVETNSYTVLLYNADKTSSSTIQADAQGRVLTSDFKSYIETLYGKAPATRNVPMDIQGFATTPDGVTIKNTGTAQANVTIVAPYIDENGYYLVGDMFTAWDKDHAHAFTHQGSGSVYDDPEFTIVFQTTAANQYWKIIPAENYNSADGFWTEGEHGVVGVVTDGDDSPSGNLTTTSPKAGKIPSAGYHRMTINMMNYSYTIEDLNFPQYLYEIGNDSGWGTNNTLYGANFDGNYLGYYYLNGIFKFRDGSDWSGAYNLGKGASSNTLVNSGSSPNIDDIDENNAGFYRISVNIADMTYSLLKVNSISIIGNNNDWGTDEDMTYNASTGNWEWTGNLSGDGIKFRVNHDWTYSWGGKSSGSDFDNLTENNGQNLTPPNGAGNYKIILTVHQEDGDCKVKFEKL